MTTFEAKVTEQIPANRLVALGGVNTEGDVEVGWETIYLKLAEAGWTPDFVSNSDLEKGQVVKVTIKDNPTWTAEASERIPAGTLVQADVDGCVKNYRPEDGSHIGYSIHSAEDGELVTFVRKYGFQLPESQIETMSIPVEDANLEDYPIHTGGGYYELSNGEKVQGKDRAIKAENKLTEK